MARRVNALGRTAPLFIGAEIESKLTWREAVQAIKDGHTRPRAQLGDTLLPTESGELLTRSATIADFGAGVKAATIIQGNPSQMPPRPTVQGAFLLFEPATGALKAVVDGPLLTRWKTVADSLAGASILAMPDPKILTVVGTGLIAAALIEGYQSHFPTINRVLIWGRSREKAQALADHHKNAEHVDDLREALREADIITSATAATTPIIPGDAVKPGAHIDLIGAHSPTMREADDALIAGARVFVDCRETTIDHIGEIALPIKYGTITRDDIEGDLYDLCAAKDFQRGLGEITFYKNGGGAHLDLMLARYFADIVDRY